MSVTHYSYLWTSDMGDTPPVLREHKVVVRDEVFMPESGHHLPGMRSYLPLSQLHRSVEEAAAHFTNIQRGIIHNTERQLEQRRAAILRVL